MNRTKTILLSTAVLSILMITTTTATASQFSSGGTAVKGTSELSKGTTAEFSLSATSLPIETTKAQDTWTIQDSKAQIITKIGGVLAQEITFRAPHFTNPETGQPIFVGINNPIMVLFKTGDDTISLSKGIELKIPVSTTKTCVAKATAASNTALKGFKDTIIGFSLDLVVTVHSLTIVVAPAPDCLSAGVTNTTTAIFIEASLEIGLIQV